jgi:hypothetical protein
MVIDAIDPARPSVGDHAFASYQSSPFGYCARKMPPIPLIRKSEDGLLLLIADSMLTTKRQLNLTIVITTSVAPPELELELLADGAEPRTYRPTKHSCRERDATCVCCAVVPHPTSDDLEWQVALLYRSREGNHGNGYICHVDASGHLSLLPLGRWETNVTAAVSNRCYYMWRKRYQKALPASQHHVGCPKEERRTCIAPIARRVGSRRKWNCDVNLQTLIDQLPRCCCCSEAWRWGWVI